MQPAIYILTNKPNGILYTGVTSNLPARIAQHSAGGGSQFTKKYHVHMLVYAEFYPSMAEAIHREKRIKAMPRSQKVSLILAANPTWVSLVP